MGTVHRFPGRRDTSLRSPQTSIPRSSRLARLACPVCCSFHAEATECPGDLKATGPERHGWRVNVETPVGFEAFGVLVAPSRDLWRARIITLPNVLWMAPGGFGTLKFFATTPQEAERRAIAFIEQHCELNGYLRRDALEKVRPGAVTAEAAPAAAARPGGPPPRKARILPVRFGVSRPSTLAQTVNLSREGMFVGTPVPLARGEACRIALHVEGISMALHGIVMWNRARLETGRPLGMGVRLLDPPPAYGSYVETLP